MDDALRTSLWNIVQERVWGKHKSQSGYSYTKHSNLFKLIKCYWKDYFKIPINDIPQHIQDAIDSVRQSFFASEWFEVYDFIEFTSSVLGDSRPLFVLECNEVLEREMSAYRIIKDQVTPITSSEELSAIEAAMEA